MKDFDLKNIKQADHSDTSFSSGSLRAARGLLERSSTLLIGKSQ
jgi:hypothetical protein